MHTVKWEREWMRRGSGPWIWCLDFNLCVYTEQPTCNYLGITPYMKGSTVSKSTSGWPHFCGIREVAHQYLSLEPEYVEFIHYSYIISTNKEQPTPVSCLGLKMVTSWCKSGCIFHTPALTLWMFFKVVPTTGKYVLRIGSFGFHSTWSRSPSCPV